MAEAVGGAVERGEEEAGGAIEEHDGVAAADVEGEGAVELDALGGEIRGDAGAAGHEGRRSDDEALGGGADGGDGVRGAVEGVEEEGFGRVVASDLVGRVAAAGARAQWERDGRRAARRTQLGLCSGGEAEQQGEEEEEEAERVKGGGLLLGHYDRWADLDDRGGLGVGF